MPRLLLVLLALSLVPLASAQGSVHNSVEEMPELIGGLAALQGHIHYPAEALERRIEGRVMVQFIVDELGHVIEPSILQSAGPELEEAALEALGQVEFRPGRHEGQPARVRMILPIMFVLPEETRRRQVDIADYVDEMPSIIGGMGAFVDLLEYPEEAEERGIEGRVLISFVVGRDGAVEEAAIMQSAHPLLDEAALEAILKTRFNPGRNNGQAVRVRMALPVTFDLPE